MMVSFIGGGNQR